MGQILGRCHAYDSYFGPAVASQPDHILYRYGQPPYETSEDVISRNKSSNLIVENSSFLLDGYIG